MLFDGMERNLDAFENKIFPINIEDIGFLDKISDHSNLKTLTPKQMLQRLQIALARVRAGNTSKNLLNEIIKILYSLYQAKEITKKVYNNIMNSVKA